MATDKGVEETEIHRKSKFNAVANGIDKLEYLLTGSDVQKVFRGTMEPYIRNSPQSLELLVTCVMLV